MKLPIVIWLLVLTSIFGCGADPVAIESFVITQTTPVNGATNISVNTSIEIDVNKDLASSSLSLAPDIVRIFPVNVPHTIQPVGNRRIQIRLLKPLLYGSLVTVEITPSRGSKILDNDGLLLNGESGESSYSITFVTEIDEIPPSRPLPTPLFAYTNEPIHKVQGTREPFSLLRVGKLSSATATSTSLALFEESLTDSTLPSNAFVAPIQLEEGENFYGFQSMDLASNLSGIVVVRRILDTVRPNKPTINSAPSALTNVAQATYSGSYEENARIVVEHNGNGVLGTSGASTWSAIINLTEGDNIIRFTVEDQANNRSEVVEQIIVLDTTKPQITVSNTPTLTFASSIDVEGTVNEVATIYVNGIAQSGSTSFDQNVAVGVEEIQKIEITAIDPIGNQSRVIRYVERASASVPSLQKQLPEDGVSVTAPAVAQVYFFDQQIVNTPNTAQFTFSASNAANAAIIHNGYAVRSQSPIATGVVTATSTYGPADKFGRIALPSIATNTATVFSGDGVSAPYALTASTNNDRATSWNVSWGATTNAVYYVVEAVATDSLGTVHTSVWHGPNGPATIQSPLTGVPVDFSVFAYGAAGDRQQTALAAQTPPNTLLSLGKPTYTELPNAVTTVRGASYQSAGNTIIAVADSLAERVGLWQANGAGYLGLSSTNQYSIDHASSVDDFGTSITVIGTDLMIGAAGSTTCIYQTTIVPANTTLSATDEHYCGGNADGTGEFLAADTVNNTVITSQPNRGINGSISSINSAGIATTLTDNHGAFSIAPGFGSTSWVAAHHRSGNKDFLTVAPTNDFSGTTHSFPAAKIYDLHSARWNADGDEHDDLVVISTSHVTQPTMRYFADFYVFSGGDKPVQDITRSQNISGITELCSFVIGVIDWNLDGIEDLLCQAIENNQAVMYVLQGSPTFFTDSSITVYKPSNVDYPHGYQLYSGGIPVNQTGTSSIVVRPRTGPQAHKFVIFP